MTYISLENITKTFGAQTLFKGLNLGIQDHDKIGLIGLNGTGKSTLLNILSGKTPVDDGKITKIRDLRIASLEQSPDFNEALDLISQVRDFLSESAPDTSEYEIKSMLNHLSLPNHEDKVAVLSGGQKKRLALAATLLTPCDLLILDEPTNHMDNDTIDWLENYLKRLKNGLIMVTHDRYFLERIVNRIIEVADQTVYSYDGNYETFLDQKSERMRVKQVTQSRVKNLYLRELAWIRAGVQGRGTKARSRIQRFESIKSQLSNANEEAIQIASGFTRLGKKILEAESLVIGYEAPLNTGFTYMAKPNDRIGIIGNNGSGKTTFLNTLAQTIPPFSGSFEWGPTVKIGYFTQTPETNQESDIRAIDYIKETAEYVTTADGFRLSASDLMEQFLFDSALQYTTIGTLSGGERRRLQLLKVLIDAPNVLLLDEPTNNLDLDTLKALELYLDTLEGIVICISHDRYFIDRTCDQLFVFSKGETIETHAGNYSDYKVRLKELASSLEDDKGSSNSHNANNQNGNDKPAYKREKTEKKKLTFKEERQLESLPAEIESLEEKIEAIQEDMTKFASDFAKIQTLYEEKEHLEITYFEKLELYEDLMAQKASFEK